MSETDELFDLRHDSFTQADGRLRYFAAERATVMLIGFTERRTHQLCQVIFSKRVGSLFVQFPYFPDAPGIVGRYELLVGPALESDIRLTDTGRVSSHRVKYSHPPDGNAHFSQDGKVVTEVRRSSINLLGDEGRLFELHAFGVSGFARIDPGQEKRGRLYLPFAVEQLPAGVSITGEWIRKSRLKALADARQDILGPVADLPRATDGALYRACLVAPPDASPTSSHVLAINLHPQEAIDADASPHMHLLGGWDRDLTIPRPGDVVGCLAFSYPCANADALRAQIGTIDLPRNADTGDQ